jgi:hypothetical protein
MSNNLLGAPFGVALLFATDGCAPHSGLARLSPSVR